MSKHSFVDLALLMGSDSITASSLNGLYKGSFAIADKAMNFEAKDATDNSFNYVDGNTKLSTYIKPSVGKGLSFSNDKLLFNLENNVGDKGLFKFKTGTDSIFAFINDNGKHTFNANYSGLSFNTEYKKDGDKFIKFISSDYAIDATEKASEKNINLKG